MDIASQLCLPEGRAIRGVSPPKSGPGPRPCVDDLWIAAPRVWDAGAVTVYKIRFEGPAALVLGIATALADADGVELTSSAKPSILDEHTVELNVSVEGTRDAVVAAVSSISDGLPRGASIEIADE
jgi:hypothetical protein